MHSIESHGLLVAMDEQAAYDVLRYRFVAIEAEAYLLISIYEGVANINDYTNGHILLMQIALSYVSQKHPTIIDYEIQDDTFVNVPGYPLITARRLLQGEKGWYEEHFGAIPTQRTILLLDWLRDPEHRLLFPKEKENSWWSPSNVMKVCSLIGCPYSVIGTTWCIHKKSIIEFEKEIRCGGANENEKKFKRIIKNAKGLCHTTVLEAKYRNNE